MDYHSIAEKATEALVRGGNIKVQFARKSVVVQAINPVNYWVLNKVSVKTPNLSHPTRNVPVRGVHSSDENDEKDEKAIEDKVAKAAEKLASGMNKLRETVVQKTQGASSHADVEKSLVQLLTVMLVYKDAFNFLGVRHRTAFESLLASAAKSESRTTRSACAKLRLAEAEWDAYLERLDVKHFRDLGMDPSAAALPVVGSGLDPAGLGAALSSVGLVPVNPEDDRDEDPRTILGGAPYTVLVFLRHFS